MYIVVGGTGHIGAALAERLIERGEAVTVVTRDEGKRAAWEARGARVAVLDVRDVAALRALFRAGKRAFLLNPPAAPSSDVDVEERRTARALVDALSDSGLELVVAESTYGAQPGAALGDLGVLYEFERALRAQRMPVRIMRGAYYMSNWDMSLASARDEGRVHTLLPADFALPMVAPADIAELASRLISGDVGTSGPHHVEGPRHYTPRDVADAFAAALARPVEVVSAPPERWLDVLRELGFSQPAAESFANMTRVTLEQGAERPASPVRGRTGLDAYVEALVRRVGPDAP